MTTLVRWGACPHPQIPDTPAPPLTHPVSGALITLFRPCLRVGLSPEVPAVQLHHVALLYVGEDLGHRLICVALRGRGRNEPLWGWDSPAARPPQLPARGAHPAPVEGAGQVIASAQGKDGDRWWRF